MPWLAGAPEADGVVGIRWNDSGSHREDPAARAVGEVAATTRQGRRLTPSLSPPRVEGARPRVGLVDGLGQSAPSHLLKGTLAIMLKFASFIWNSARNFPEPVIEQ